MKISKTIETPDGGMEFKGELNQEETDFMVEWFLNSMLSQGALPFTTIKDGGSIPAPASSTEQ